MQTDGPLHLIDTHCHLDLNVFSSEFSEVVDRARQAGVQQFILPGVTASGWSRLLKICQKEQGFFAAPGLHPMYLGYHDIQTELQLLSKIITEEKVVAIGEIGLDYFKEHLDRNVQQVLFESQIAIATKAGLPILLHSRKAHDQVLATLRRKQFTCGGIVHAFSGSLQQAKQYVGLGFCIGVGGTITYDRAKKVRRVVSELPPESLVLETDSPDIPVANHNGEINLPEYLLDIVHHLAQLRNESVIKTAEYTTNNAKRILNI